MKRKFTYLALAALAFGIITSPKTTAKNSAIELPHEVVILHGYEQQTTVSLPPSQGSGYAWSYSGIYVLNASWSSNAPNYRLPIFYPSGSGEHPNAPLPIPLAQALADLLSNGYRIEHINQDNLRYTLVR